MSSIDNRIVILTFDNKDFEGNVQTSLGTLEKLKKGLDLNESAKGLSAVSNSAKHFSLSGIGDAIDGIKYRFSTLGVIGATAISELTKSAMNVGKNILSAVAGPLTSGGWNRALNIEQAKFQLEGLGIAWDDIKDDINYGVKDTAYGLDAAAKAASQLAASGIQLGDEMKSSLRGISGVAAMTSSSYEDISSVFTKVAGQGRVMGDDLLRLASRGLNAAATLGQYLGKTEAEVREMVTAGEIDFRTFAAAMDDAFGEHAKDANKTFTGAMANVRAALSRIGADVAATQLTNLRDIFNALIPLIDNIHTALGPLIETFNTFATKATEGVVGFINELNSKTPAAKQNAKEVGEAITELKDSGFKDFDKLAESMGITVEEFDKMAEEGRLSTKKLVDAMDKAFGEETPSILDKFREKVEESTETLEDTAETATAAAEEIDEAAQRVINGEFGNDETRREQLEALGLSYEEVQNKVNELLGVEYRYEVETKEATEETEKLSKSLEDTSKYAELTASSVKKTETPVSNFAAGLSNLRDTLSKVSGAIGSAFKDVFSGSFSGALQKISNGFKNLTEKLLLTDNAVEGIRIIFVGLFTVIKVGIKTVGKIISIFGKFIGLVGSGIVKVLDKIGELNKSFEESGRKARLFEAIGGVVEKLGDIFSKFKEKVVEVSDAIKNSEGFQKLQNALSKLWEVIKEFAGSIFDSFVEKLEDFGNYNPDFSWLDAFVDLLSKGAEKLADFILALINGENPIKNFFENLGNTEGPTSKVISFLSKIKEKVAEFFQGFSVNDLSVSNFAEKIKEFFQQSFADIGNSGFADGLGKFFSNIKDKLGNINWEKVGEDAEKIAGVILKFVAAIEAIKLLKSATGMFNSVKETFESLRSVFSEIGGLLRTAKKKMQVEMVKGIAISVGILVAALFVLTKIPEGELERGAETLVTVLAAVVGAFVIIDKANIDGSNLAKFSAAVMGLSIGLILLSGAIKIFSIMKPETLLKGGAAVVGFMTLMSLAAKIAGEGGSFGAFVGLALAVDLLVPAIAILGHMNPNTLLQGGIAIAALVSVLAIAAKYAEDANSGAAALVAMAVPLAVFVIGIKVLETVDMPHLVVSAVLLSAFMFALAGAASLAKEANSGAVAMVAMAVPLAVFIIGIKVLETVDFPHLLISAGLLAAMMVVLAGTARWANDARDGAINMAIMAAPLAAAALSLYIVSQQDLSGLIAAAACLSGLLIAMAGSAKLANDARDGAINMLLMSVPLIAAVIALKTLSDIDWDKLVVSAGVLSAVLLVLAGTVNLANNAKSGAIIMLAMTVPLLAATFAIAKLAEYDWHSLVAAAGSLSAVILTMSVAAVILQAVPIPGAIAAVASLAILLGGLTGIIALIGLINSDILSHGVENFGLIGQAIGNFVGSIISSAAEAISSSLPTIGDNISAFAENIKPFIETAKSIDGSVIDGIASLAGALLILTGAELIDGIFSFFNGGESAFVSFGKELNEFAPYFVSFAESISGINASDVESSANAALALAEFADKIPDSGGLVAKITGDNSIAEFGAELESFGPHLKAYADSIQGIDGDDVVASANAATALAEFAGKIPNSGGLVSKVTGDNDLGQFAESLAAFGPAFATYCEAVSGINEEEVVASARAATALAEFAGKIPNSGGLVSKVTGDNDLGQFALSLAAFGPAFSLYCASIRDIDEEKVVASANAATAIVDFASKIPNAGGLVSKVTGDNDLISFGTQLSSFGPSFASYANSIKNINESAVVSSAAAASACADFAQKIPENGGLKALFSDSSLSKFGKELAAFGPYLKTYSDSINGVLVSKMESINELMPETVDMTTTVNSSEYKQIDDYGKALKNFGEKLNDYNGKISGINTSKVSQVVAVVYELIEVANSMAVVDTASMGNFGNELENCGKVGVEGFIAAFENSVSDAMNAGSALVNSAADGARDSSDYGTWYSIGQYAVEGFINGLDSLYYSVYNSAYSIGSAAVSGAQNALLVMSPSRKMFEIGEYTGQGLINGMVSMESDIFKTGYSMGDSVLDAIENPLSKIKDIIDSDADLNPVITPVLDLSDVTNGFGGLNGLFGNRQVSVQGSYGLSAISNLNSIRELANDMAASNFGDNSDVVDAISEMRQDIMTLGDSISKMQIRLDGQALVGEIIDPIDNALGMRAEYAGRGIY